MRQIWTLLLLLIFFPPIILRGLHFFVTHLGLFEEL